MSESSAPSPVSSAPASAWNSLGKDLGAGLVVFLVALPLCLGIALASGAPMVAGIVSGVVGGLLVAWLSGSHTSVSGPAAGLVAVVLTQVAVLGSYEAFLVAVILAGAIQVLFGALRAGFIAAFFPSSVIKGLLAAIGLILVLKQIPHAVGHDADPEGDMGFLQVDGKNTISELFSSLFDLDPGAMMVGLVSLAVLLAWDRSRFKNSLIPAPLVVVLLGVTANLVFKATASSWVIGASHLVQLPTVAGMGEFLRVLPSPDLKAFGNPAIIMAAVTIAIVASLETLLNLEAVDKLDPRKRVSPPNRELMAQGAGNMVSGLLGGLRHELAVRRTDPFAWVQFVHGLEVQERLQRRDDGDRDGGHDDGGVAEGLEVRTGQGTQEIPHAGHRRQLDQVGGPDGPCAGGRLQRQIGRDAEHHHHERSRDERLLEPAPIPRQQDREGH